MTDYEALKLFGYSPAKAKEIEIDAKRGDKKAAAIIEIAKKEFAR